jgi:hypothetical protein
MINFIFENNKYELEYECINIFDSCEIDYNSYNENYYSSFREFEEILKKISFKIKNNGNLIFDSKKDNYKFLKFKFVKLLVDILSKELNNSSEEIQIFTQECRSFLEKNTTRMPKELLIAENIYLQKITLSYDDLKNMPCKQYERINVALSLINQKVNPQ